MAKRELSELLQCFKVGDQGGQIRREGKGMEDVCDFQDAVARLNSNAVILFYGSLSQADRRHFVWVCLNTLDYEHALEIIRSAVIREERTKMYEEVYAEDMRRTNVLDEREKEIERREHEIMGYQERIKELDHQVLMLREERETLYSFKEDARKFYAIKNLLSS